MKSILTAATVLLIVPAFAQDIEKTLDPVSVTASLQPKPVSATGRNIISFRMDEFANMPVHSLDELLRYIPGLEMQMRGPMGSQSDIVLRGGTFQQVLVLVDGVRVNDPNTGHFSSYIPISPAEIDRIEVLKGASSAIYGSEAVGGVVHIITKTFSARQKQQSLKVQAQISGGEYDYIGVNTGAFYQKGQTAVGGGWLSNNTDGQLQRGTRGYVNNNTVSLSLSQFVNEHWQVAVRGAWDNRDFSAQNFYTTFISDTANEEVGTWWTQARVSYVQNKHRINLDAGYKDVQDDYYYNKVSIPNNNKSRMLQGTITDEWKAGNNTTIISGAQYIRRTIRSNDRGNHDVPQGGLFILLNQTIAQKLTINPALRLDWNERSGTELVPQLSMAYKLRNFNFRASGGRTVRDADFTERFNNYNKTIVASGRIGNPDLEPETSISYEAGLDYLPAKEFRIAGTFFQRFHKQLIDYVTTPYAQMPRKDNLVAGGTYALAQNISEVNTTGVEVDFQLQKKISKGMLNGGLGFVWLHSKSSNAVPSFYVSSHAKFMTNLYAELRYGKFLISMNGLYKDRNTQTATAINAKVTESYIVLNTKAAFFMCNGKLNIFAQIDNLTDVEYSDLLGAVMPGRWMMGGISYSLSR